MKKLDRRSPSKLEEIINDDAIIKLKKNIIVRWFEPKAIGLILLNKINEAYLHMYRIFILGIAYTRRCRLNRARFKINKSVYEVQSLARSDAAWPLSGKIPLSLNSAFTELFYTISLFGYNLIFKIFL